MESFLGHLHPERNKERDYMPSSKKVIYLLMFIINTQLKEFRKQFTHFSGKFATTTCSLRDASPDKELKQKYMKMYENFQAKKNFSSLSVLSEEGKSSIALASFSKWVYDQRFGNFRRNYKLFWPLKKNKHCEVLVSCSDWVDWIDFIELNAVISPACQL